MAKINYKKLSTEELAKISDAGKAASEELVARAKKLSAISKLSKGRVKTTMGIWFPASQTPEKAGIYRTSDCPNLGWAYSKWTGKSWSNHGNWGTMHTRSGCYWQQGTPQN